MKYALIADVHGNYPALHAVLRDAAAQHVKHFLFLGDYYGDFPFPNQVIEAIRSLPSAAAIRGNKEDYLVSLSAQDPSNWTDEQLAPLYWAYETLTEENRAHLTAMPEEVEIRAHSIVLHGFHASRQYFSGTNLMRLGSRSYAQRMNAKPFTPAEYSAYIEALLSGDEVLRRTLADKSGHVFAFGHSHIQWHCWVNGALLINPGSCGLPLDFDPRAPYDILHIDDHNVRVEERRIPYDLDDVVQPLRDSELFRRAPIWSEIGIRQLRTGEEEISFFLESVEVLSNKMNRPNRPHDNDIWRAAGDDWFRIREKL